MKKNDDRYWFPAKRYGWGWGPPTAWQGWVVYLGWFAVVALAGFRLLPLHMVGFLLFVMVMVIVLLGVCYAKGEPPGWSWGD